MADVVPHCAGLPLALRIVGARLALIREDVADVVKTLADESQRLDYLVAGDRAVRASLDLTLSVATAQARQLFARLALVGADEFAPWVAAPLLDVDEHAAQPPSSTPSSLSASSSPGASPHPATACTASSAPSPSSSRGTTDNTELEQRYLETVLRLLDDRRRTDRPRDDDRRAGPWSWP